MLQSLTIENFRGIKRLEMEDFGRVNVFIGENGSGKTTALEAVSMIAYPWVDVHGRIGVRREMSRSRRSLSYMFHQNGHDFLLPICLTALAKDTERYQLKITPLSQYDVQESISDHSTDQNEIVRNWEEIYGVEHHFKDVSGKQFKQRMLFLDGAYVPQRPTAHINSLDVNVIESGRTISITETSNILTDLFKSRQLNTLIEGLQIVEPNLRNLTSGTQEDETIILADIGDHVTEINVLGDGFNRILLMLTSIFDPDVKMVVIDEIDAGIYHEVMPKLWKWISDLTRSQQKQLFCVTHNEEMLDHIAGVFENEPDAVRVYRTEKWEDGTHHAVKMDYERLSSVMERRWEIR